MRCSHHGNFVSCIGFDVIWRCVSSPTSELPAWACILTAQPWCPPFLFVASATMVAVAVLWRLCVNWPQQRKSDFWACWGQTMARCSSRPNWTTGCCTYYYGNWLFWTLLQVEFIVALSNNFYWPWCWVAPGHQSVSAIISWPWIRWRGLDTKLPSRCKT